MESLPIELKLHVFDCVQELPTLSTLVHAFPSFYKIYAANRAEIFTAVTLRSLEARGILFTEPISWAEVCLTAGKGAVLPRPWEADSLLSIFKKINLHIESKSRSRMVFSVKECHLLGKILHIVAYSVEKKNDDIMRISQGKIVWRISGWQSQMSQPARYHLLEFIGYNVPLHHEDVVFDFTLTSWPHHAEIWCV